MKNPSFILFFLATAALADTAHSLTEPGFDPELHAGDSIALSCTGEAKVSGKLRVFPREGAIDDSFSIDGPIRIQTDGASGTAFDQMVEYDSGISERTNSKRFSLSLYLNRTFFVPEIFADYGGDGFVRLNEKSKKLSIHCEIQKIDPLAPRAYLGNLHWVYPTEHQKVLHFQSDDELANDGADYLVMADDAVFAKLTPLIDKSIRVVARATDKNTMQIDGATMALEPISLCNIQANFNYGPKYTAALKVYHRELRFLSQATAQDYANSVCTWFNANPFKTFEGNTGYNYSCKAICK